MMYPLISQYSYRFPDDPRLIPAVGNGHLATQVLNDVIYVNNVYNGYSNSSHRAKIPSTGFKVIDDLEQSLYILDMFTGIMHYLFCFFTLARIAPLFFFLKKPL